MVKLMRILIVGAGIAGLTLAQLLRQRSIDAVIVEKEADRNQRGYGISLWAMGSRVLYGLKLWERFAASSVPIGKYRILDRRGELVRSYDFSELFGEHEAMRMITHRELIEILGDGIEDAVRMHTTVANLQQQDDRVHVTFSDHTADVFDLVAGCDGIHSGTRRQIFGDLPLRDTGWGGWAWWSDSSFAPHPIVTEYWAPDRFFGMYPAKDALFCFAGMPKKEIQGDPHHPDTEFIKRSFQGLGGDVPHVVESVGEKQGSLFFWDFSDLSLDRWHDGRVLLIGDASSAILPTAGIGASCAMESAAVLADELTRTDAAHIPLMLDRYFKRRHSRVDRMEHESRTMARLMFIEWKPVTIARDALLKITPREMEFNSFRRLLEEPI